MKALLATTLLSILLISNIAAQNKQPYHSNIENNLWNENTCKGKVESITTIHLYSYSDSTSDNRIGTDTLSIKKYNEQGQLIEQINSSVGENGIYEKIILTYNNQHQLVQREYTDYILPDTFTTMYMYNDKGLIEEQVTTRTDNLEEVQTTILTYNERGNIICHYQHHTADTSSYTKTQYQYWYDKQKRIIQVNNTSTNVQDSTKHIGTPLSTFYQYDKQGRLVKTETVLLSSSLNEPTISATEYKYDKQDRIIQATKREGKRDIVVQYKYDDMGNMVQLTKGKTIAAYRYDEHGNWIRSTINPNAKNSYICERKIEYYK